MVLLGLAGALALIILALAVMLPIVGVPVAMPPLLTPWNASLLLIVAILFLGALIRTIQRIGLSAYHRLFRIRKYPDAEDHHAQKLFEHLQEACIPSDAENIYGVVGHTHRPDVQVLDRDQNRRFIYLNSGTWVPNWRDKRSNLRSGTEFSFLRFDWKKRLGEYRHSSRVWRDDRGVEGGSVENVIIARMS
jgi:hypothetical protein